MPKISSTSWPIPPAAPVRVGLCRERLGRAGDYLERLIADRALAGAITLVARHGRLAHLRCHGLRDVARGLPMREDTIFRAYSMTKPVVCAAILMLYEELALSLHDPVRRFLPEFAAMRVATGDGDATEPPRRDLTIHDLLTHTGGLGYGLAHEFGWTGRDSAAFISEFCRLPLLGHPGERWRYSSSNDVLGRIVEVVTGQPLDVALAERIFRPLGMRDAGFHVPAAKRGRFAVLYGHDEQSHIIPCVREDRPYLERPAFLSGGAGLVCTTADWLRFALMLLGGGALGKTRLLSPKTVALMRQDHLPDGHGPIEPFKFGYGYGVSVLRSLREKQDIGSPGEFGWGGAAGTNCWIDPAEDMVSMVMFQLKPSRIPFIDHRVKVALTQAVVA